MRNERNQALLFLQVYLLFRDARVIMSMDLAYEVAEACEGVGLHSDVFCALSKDEDDRVRMAVAANPRCPESILRVLAFDEKTGVREAAMRNPNCPEDLLRKTVMYQEWRFRLEVARNPRCPEDLLLVLAEDLVPDVREIAIDRLNNNWRNVYSAKRSLFRIPERFLPAFAAPPDPDEAFSAIKRLVRADRLFFQVALVTNPETPIELLRRLLRCKNPTAWKLIAEHPNADDELRAAVARKFLMAA